ncbi:class I SAM-dependent methyltransferase, partial [Salmonella enterica subsp. enterica serovar Enteritidis]|nr:class I SAM-dependent methyltransferase [Salmonella enterica subsp. enterica serovar Enteritidis]
NLSLRELYAAHDGYSSDKWDIYLNEYNRLFSEFRNAPIRLLEIGIQNGGSLELWSKFFQSTKIIVGCDIDEKCHKINYPDNHIKLVIGNINDPQTLTSINNHSEYFDIIIDDGSHTSGDIINSFLRLFPKLNLNGLYIIEDLHCSYWSDFEGGLFHPSSSINFLKSLVDILNFEHWGLPLSRISLLNRFNIPCSTDNEDILSEIHSIEFINSMCIIRKQADRCNRLGVRHVAGNKQPVSVNKHADNTFIKPQAQSLSPPPPYTNTEDYINSMLDRISVLEQMLESYHMNK